MEPDTSRAIGARQGSGPSLYVANANGEPERPGTFFVG